MPKEKKDKGRKATSETISGLVDVNAKRTDVQASKTVETLASGYDSSSEASSPEDEAFGATLTLSSNDLPTATLSGGLERQPTPLKDERSMDSKKSKDKRNKSQSKDGKKDKKAKSSSTKSSSSRSLSEPKSTSYCFNHSIVESSPPRDI